MTSAPSPKPDPQAPPRVISIDVYRGLVMFLMMAEVLRLRAVAGNLPDSSLWKFLAWHQTHVPWAGCTLHDLIQPSFSFLVGVSLPYSLARREQLGGSRGWMVAHAVWRAVLLVFLGIFLRSMGKEQTNFTFDDTLTQIGFGYVPLFFLGFVSPRWQWGALVAILISYWAAFALYPLPPADFDYAAVGVPADWTHNYTGFAAHWNKNSNLAWAVDTWWMNLFPRPEKFLFHSGGYATLSFIPTLGTMILGLIAGGWLKSDVKAWQKVGRFTALGIGLIVLGTIFDRTGICPSVKRIWTPSWVLFSGGWCFLLLAGFYGWIDVAKFQSPFFPLRVIGANSIVAYCLAHGSEGFIVRTVKTHFGANFFERFGHAYEPLFEGLVILLVYWLILWWMYRRKLFVRI